MNELRFRVCLAPTWETQPAKSWKLKGVSEYAAKY